MPIFIHHISRATGIIVITTALLTLAGWFFQWPLLRSVVPEMTSMKFNTAIGFLFSGLVLLFRETGKSSFLSRIVSPLFSWLIFLLGMLTFSQHLFNWNSGIDEWLWKQPDPYATGRYPGRMNPVTSFMFMLLGMIFILLNRKRFHLFIQVTLFLVVALASLSALHRFFGNSFLDGISPVTDTSVHSALLFILLCLGIRFVPPLRYLSLDFRRQVAAFFTLTLLALGFIFFAFNRSAARSLETTRQGEHTRDVLARTGRILVHALEIQTATRGFIFSGNELYLEPYIRSSVQIFRSLRELRSLTEDNPSQQAKQDSLERLINQNISLVQDGIRLARAGLTDSVRQVFNTGINKSIMDRIRSVITEIEKEENDRLARLQEESDQHLANTGRIIIFFQVIIFLLLLLAFFVIYKNIEKRNRAETQLRLLNETLENKVKERTTELMRAESHFRETLDHLIEGVQIIGFDYRYLFVNDAVAEQGRYPKEELLHHTMMEKYPGIEQTPFFGVLKQCMHDRNPRRMENEFVYADGTSRWFELSLQPVPEGVFILSVDITGRKKAQESLVRINRELDQRADELKVSNAELERFAYVASHDLQEPLRMVSSFLQLLEKKLDGKLDETTRQYIDFAVDGSERMKKLIQDLLRYSRVGTSREGITDVDCNAVMQAVQADLALAIGEAKATLQVKPLPVIRAVYAQMVQVFENLVGNALKYHGDRPPVIDVGCVDKAAVWEFYVKDNGIGIDPRYMDKIFVLFQRLHSSIAYSGTGIGLSICKKIIEKHGGRIRAESIPGQGSTFFFTIPKQTGHE